MLYLHHLILFALLQKQGSTVWQAARVFQTDYAVLGAFAQPGIGLTLSFRAADLMLEQFDSTSNSILVIAHTP